MTKTITQDQLDRLTALVVDTYADLDSLLPAPAAEKIAQSTAEAMHILMNVDLQLGGAQR